MMEDQIIAHMLDETWFHEEDLQHRVYVAGPMTGIPFHNIPAFNAMTADLRAAGFDVVSPVELDGAEVEALYMADPTGIGPLGPGTETWGDFLARDVKQLVDDGIEAIVVLDGWERSKGARLETFVGSLVGLPVYTWGEWTGLVEVPRLALFRAWSAEPNLCIAHEWQDITKGDCA